MKIGILTFHCAHNYGAVLQCYALQEYLIGLGHEVKVIDYRPEFLLEPYRVINRQGLKSFNPVRLLKSVLREVLLAPIRCIRHYNFDRFIKNRLVLTHPVSKENIPSNFDMYIVGSDQIWNPHITRGYDNVYFCNFHFPKDNRIYASYAASMEANSLTDADAFFYRNALQNFDCLSVRERELKDLLQPLASQPIKQVIDPTLLVFPDVWNKLASNKTKKKRYVLVYQVRENKELEMIAQNIADQLGVEVIKLVAWVRYNIMNANQTASPEHFINMIKNAEYVVTSSFHGTAFSVVFNKPFYSVRLNDGKDSRIGSLLASLGLEDRFIDKTDLPKVSSIDFTYANQKLEILRKKSGEYLKSAMLSKK